MARPRTTTLTPTHERILNSLATLTRNGGVASINDLVVALQLAGETSLVPTLGIMQRNGFVQVSGGGGQGRRRTVALTSKGMLIAGLGGTPVLGSIPAGALQEAIQQTDEFVNLGTALHTQSGDFILIVTGYSMIGDGILPNDKVLLRPDVQVQNGEIAAVHYSEQYLATLKHVCFNARNEYITLRASNDEYADIAVSGQDLKIAGVFRGLIRSI